MGSGPQNGLTKHALLIHWGRSAHKNRTLDTPSRECVPHEHLGWRENGLKPPRSSGYQFSGQYFPTSCYYIQIDDAEAKDNRYTRTVRTMWPYARSEHVSDQLVSQSELQRVKIDRDRACGAPKSASGAIVPSIFLPPALGAHVFFSCEKNRNANMAFHIALQRTTWRATSTPATRIRVSVGGNPCRGSRNPRKHGSVALGKLQYNVPNAVML